jgi:membrane protein YqaA with SNARE-associated domain
MEALLDYGYIGLFIGAFLAATLLPFSSDVLLVGLLAAGGDPYIAVAVATLGNWLGGMSSFGIGWLGKWEWITKWLKVSREKLERQKARVDKYGSALAFFTWLPLIGDVMAVALGFYRTDPKKTALFMLIGKCARFVMWAVLFYWVKPMLEGHQIM